MSSKYTRASSQDSVSMRQSPMSGKTSLTIDTSVEPSIKIINRTSLICPTPKINCPITPFGGKSSNLLPFRTSFEFSKQISCLSVLTFGELTWLVGGCTGGEIILQEVVENCHLDGHVYELCDKDSNHKHTGRVTGIAIFSKDKCMHVVSSSLDRSVLVWKFPFKAEHSCIGGQYTISCEVTLVGCKRFDDAFTSVAVHTMKPSPDKERHIIATTGRDNRLCFFDLSNVAQKHYCPVVNYYTGNIIMRMAHQDWVTGVVLYTPRVHLPSFRRQIKDPPLVAVTCGMDRTVRVWTLAIGDIQGGPISEKVYVSVKGKKIRRRDSKYSPETSQKEVGSKQIPDDWTHCVVGRHHTAGVTCVTYHERDDPLIISGDNAGLILLWSANATEMKKNCESRDTGPNTNKEFDQLVPLRRLQGHKEGINTLTVINRVHGMNWVLVSSSDDKLIKFWDIELGEMIRSLQGHKSSAGAVVLLPDNIIDIDEFEPCIASADVNGKELFVWNFRSKEELTQPKVFPSDLEGHRNAITCCKFFRYKEKLLLISSSKDTTVRLFDPLNGHKHIVQISRGSTHEKEVTALELYQVDGNTYCITAGADLRMKVWKIDDKTSSIIKDVAVISTITCLALLTPEVEDEKDRMSYIVAGCVDRNICIFSMKSLLDVEVKSEKMEPEHLYRSHEDSVYQIVALNGNLLQKKDALIVSSSVRGEILVWRWPIVNNVLEYSTFNFPGMDGKMFLTVCTPLTGLPFIACCGDISNIIRTWNPWNMVDADKLSTSKHWMNESDRFISKITAINSYTPQTELGAAAAVPIIMVGHDDGSHTFFDSVSLKSESKFNKDARVDDGDTSNDVVCITRAHDDKEELTVVGYGNSLIKVFTTTNTNDEILSNTLEGRDAYVQSCGFINPSNNGSRRPSHLLVACNDKCLRIIEISDSADKGANLLPKKEISSLDCFESMANKDFVVCCGDKHFGIYEICGDSKRCVEICSGVTAKNEAQFAKFSAVKFFDYLSVKQENNGAAIKTIAWLPLVISTDSDGMVRVWKWSNSSNQQTLEEKSSFNVLKIYEDERSKKLAKIAKKESSDNLSVVSGIRKGLKSCPIFCMDVCVHLKFVVVGTMLGFPIILDLDVSCSSNDANNASKHEPLLKSKEKQFKVDKMSDGSCHSAAISALCVCTRVLEHGRFSVDIITGSKDKSFIIWDYMKRKKIVGPIEVGCESAIKTITVFDPVGKGFSATGSPVIVITCGDNLVRIFSYKGELMRTLDLHTRPLLTAEIILSKDAIPILVTSSVDNTLKYTDAYFILTNTFPTRATVTDDFNSDRKDFIDKKPVEKWHRMREMCRLATSERILFSENSKLFMRSMFEQDNYNFMETFFRQCPDAILIPQKIADIEATLVIEKEREKWQDENKCYSLLTIALFKSNKADVEDIVKTITNMFNRPVKDFYDQFYPVGARVHKYELVKLAEVYPSQFLSLIKDAKKIRVELLTNDKLKRRLAIGEYELRGVTDNTDLTKLWPLTKKKHSTFVQFFIDLYKANVKEEYVTPMMIMVPEFASVEMLRAYISVSKALDDVTIFDSEVGRCAFSYSWKNFGWANHSQEFCIHLTYCLVFSLSLFLFARLTDNVSFKSSNIQQLQAGFAWLLQAISLAFVIYFGRAEILQWICEYEYKFHLYLKDMWNVNDILLHLSMLIGTVFRLAYRRETDASRDTLSLCAIFMYFKILYYLRAYRPTGPLIAMIFQIAYDILPFCLVLFVVLFGFSHSFWIISLQDIVLPFGTFQNALLNSFVYMLGGFSSDFTGTTSPALGVLLYVCFMMIVAILLLNLLIALMGDSFASVKARGIAQWRMEAISVVHDQVHLMPGKKTVDKPDMSSADNPQDNEAKEDEKMDDEKGYKELLTRDPEEEPRKIISMSLKRQKKYYPKMIHALVRTSDLDRDTATEEQITDLSAKLTLLQSKLEGKLDRITKAMAKSDLFELNDDDDDDMDDDGNADNKNNNNDKVEDVEDRYYRDDRSFISDGDSSRNEEEMNFNYSNSYNSHFSPSAQNTYEEVIYEPIKVTNHDHFLYYCPKDNGWGCDGRNVDRCVKGCTGFGQTLGWNRYRCDICDFDYCQGCILKYRVRQSDKRTEPDAQTIESGQVYCLIGVSSRKLLDGRDLTETAVLMTDRYPPDKHLKWLVDDVGNEEFTLRCIANNKYLDGRNYEEEVIVSRRITPDPPLKWYIDPLGNGKFALRGVSRGKYLDGRDGENEPVMTYKHSPLENHSLQWIFVKQEWVPMWSDARGQSNVDSIESGEVYCLIGASSLKLLDGRDEYITEVVMTDRYPADKYLKWRIESIGKDQYTIRCLSNNKLLDGSYDDVSVSSTAIADNDALKWNIIPLNDKKFALRVVSSGRYLDGRNGETEALMCPRQHPESDPPLQWMLEKCTVEDPVPSAMPDNDDSEEEKREPIRVRTHQHKLEYADQYHYDGWMCDGANEPEGCVQGCNNYNQTYGWGRWRCGLCLFDHCEGCAMKHKIEGEDTYGFEDDHEVASDEESKQDFDFEKFLDARGQASVDSIEPGQVYCLIGASSRKLLDGRDSGTPEVIMTDRYPADQYLKWRIESIGKDQYTIRGIASGQYLDGSNEEVIAGFSVVDDNDARKWNIIPLSGKKFALRVVSSGRYLDGRNGETEALMSPSQNPESDPPLQWMLEKCSVEDPVPAAVLDDDDSEEEAY